MLLDFDGDPEFPGLTVKRDTRGLAAFEGGPFEISANMAQGPVRSRIIQILQEKFGQWPNVSFVTSTDGLAHWYTWGIDDVAYVFDSADRPESEIINFLPIDPFSPCPAELGSCVRLQGKAIGGRTTSATDAFGNPIFHPTFARTFAGSFALKDGSADRSEPPLIFDETVSRFRIDEDRIAKALAANGAHEIAHLFGAKHDCGGNFRLMCSGPEEKLAISNLNFGPQAQDTLTTTLTVGATIDPFEPNDLPGQPAEMSAGAFADLTLDNRFDEDFYRINVTEDNSDIRIVWTFDRSHYGDVPPPLDEWANVRVERADCVRPQLLGGGPSTGTNASNISSFISADDFRADSDASIDGVTIDIRDGSAAQDRRWDETVEWWILTDDGGLPGSVVASGAGENVRVLQATESPLGTRTLKVSFDFGETVPLSGGVTYWLALHLQNGYDRISVFWDGTPTRSLSPARSGGELIGGVPNFVDGAFAVASGFDKAFQLNQADPPCPALDVPVTAMDDGYLLEAQGLPAGSSFLVHVFQNVPRVPMPYGMVVTGSFAGDGPALPLPDDPREPNDTAGQASAFEPPGCDFSGTLNLASDADVDFYSINAGGSAVVAELFFDPNRGQKELLLDGVAATDATFSSDGSRQTLTIRQCGLDPSLVEVRGQRGFYDLCIRRVPDAACSGAPDFVPFVGTGSFAGTRSPPFQPPVAFERPVHERMYARLVDQSPSEAVWQIAASVDFGGGLQQLAFGQLSIPRPNPAGVVPFGPVPPGQTLLFEAVPGRVAWFQVPPVGTGDGTFEGPDDAITAFSVTGRDLQWNASRPDERATLILNGARDTDGDFIPDDTEIATGTDPLNPDTDGDGLLDGSEDRNRNGLVDDGRGDGGLTEGGSESPETDPRNPDTDGDGIPDGVESGLTVSEAGDPNFNGDEDPTTTTDPTNPDTDGDGCTDGEEDVNANGRVDPGESSPLVPDKVAEPPDPGDLDGDGDVDLDDIQVILGALNSPASGPDDPRDLDGDGTITVLDARIAVLLCTRPRCATG